MFVRRKKVNKLIDELIITRNIAETERDKREADKDLMAINYWGGVAKAYNRIINKLMQL